MSHKSLIPAVAGLVMTALPIYPFTSGKANHELYYDASLHIPSPNGLPGKECNSLVPQSSIPDSLNMTLAGYYGLDDYTSCLVLDGSYLYMNALYGFVVFDVGKDPQNPVVVASVSVGPWPIIDMAVWDHYLYLIETAGGLRTYDISDPIKPKEVDRYIFPSPYTHAWQSRIVNNHLCVAARHHMDWGFPIELYIFSLADPAHPTKVSEINLPNAHRQFFLMQVLDSNCVLVGGENPYLYLVDLNDPLHPEIKAECSVWPNQETDTLALSAFFYDSKAQILHAYLFPWSMDSGCIYTYDMTDFTHPLLTDSVKGTFVEYPWFRLMNTDTLLYKSDDTLYFFDISDNGQLDTIAIWDSCGIALWYGIEFRDKIAYCCGTFWGMHVVDRSDLSDIKDLWSAIIGAGTPDAISEIHGGKFYVSAWRPDRDPSAFLYPFFTSPTGEITASDSLRYPFILICKDIFLQGNLLGAAAFKGGVGLSTNFYDVSVQDSIRWLSTEPSIAPHRLWVDGSKLYASIKGDSYGGMAVLEISNPTLPKVLASMQLPGAAYDIEEKGGIVYVTGKDLVTGAGYLQSYRFTGDGFQGLASVSLPERGLGLSLANNVLCVSRYDALDIYDVSNTDTLLLLGTTAEMLEGRNDDVVSSGDRAYVVSDDEIVAFDVTLPSSPRLVGYYAIPNGAYWWGYRQRLRSDGQYLYWGTVCYGICVIDPYGEAEAVAESPSQNLPSLELWVMPGFSNTRTIRYELPQAARINLSVYDASGRRFLVLRQGQESSGPHEATWDASGVASGVYFVHLSSSGKSLSQPVVILR